MTIFFIICITIGAYIVLTDEYVEPNKKMVQAVSKNRTVKKNILEKFYEIVYNKIFNVITISEDREKQLEIELQSIDIQKTPKEYICYGYAQSIVYIIIGVFLSIITLKWIVLPVFVFVSYFNIKQRENEISIKFNSLKKEVERDLPKFCSVITSKLNSTNNVENIILSFYPIANGTMKKQLEITLADIRTGNTLKALERFENRIRSPHLSDITRGLRAVHNGDNQIIYFTLKQQDLNKEYRIMLEKEVDNRPLKLRPLQMCIVGLFLLCIIIPLMLSIGEMISILM